MSGGDASGAAAANESGLSAADLASIDAWMTAAEPGYAGPLTARKFETGQSNPTYRLDTAGGSYVLRRKPRGTLLKSAHAVDREYRVMRALSGAAVPVPDMIGLSEDPGPLGAQFFVMRFVPGRNFVDPRLPGVAPDQRGLIYDAMNATLAALHSIDPAAIGLGDFGRPGNYYGRQLKRWTEQYRASQTDPNPDMDALIAWLEANMIADDGPAGLVHGDYRLDNLLFAEEAPRVVAVLDWELSTLGPAINDLAYQCMQWRMPPGPEGRGFGEEDRTALGIPSEAAYVEAYCRRRGLDDAPHFNFLLAFNFFRMAAIVEGVRRRALDGAASNPESAMRMAIFIPIFVSKGLAATVKV